MQIAPTRSHALQCSVESVSWCHPETRLRPSPPKSTGSGPAIDNKDIKTERVPLQFILIHKTSIHWLHLILVLTFPGAGLIEHWQSACNHKAQFLQHKYKLNSYSILQDQPNISQIYRTFDVPERPRKHWSTVHFLLSCILSPWVYPTHPGTPAWKGCWLLSYMMLDSSHVYVNDALSFTWVLILMAPIEGIS